MMPTTYYFSVIPKLPERLKPLEEIAYNLWWTWNPDAVALFKRIDPDLWEKYDHNPVRLLRNISQQTIDSLLKNEAFLTHMERVVGELRKYMGYGTWYEWVHGETTVCRVAYFSLEFGIHESLAQYSGGLGVLAGDHIKSSSELGIPFVGIGLIYKYGYFKQSLTTDGWQQEIYSPLEFEELPLQLVEGSDGSPLKVSVELPGRVVKARVWFVQVGRNRLYLLDTDIEDNLPEDRAISHYLYGGDMEMRIKQEIVLGIGGVRVLDAINYDASVFHMNEGHSAFMAVERVRLLMEKYRIDFETAKEIVANSSVFTTHTPVPAGNDVFPPELVVKYFSEYCSKLGLNINQFLALGRINPNDPNEGFSMPVLAIKMSSYRNGVSKLHAKVSRRMWKALWPGLPESEIPITHITNGVHTRSWLADEIARLYDRYLGPRWMENPVDKEVWQRADSIPDAELWMAKQRLKERLIAFTREHLKKQLEQRGAHRTRILEAEEVLDPEALTIGFARRFATYKRAYLILKDPERLSKILNNPKMPVQIIFAGKAHPRDEHGKKLITDIINIASRAEFRNKIVFLENYDLNIARHLVQGVDVWLNTPRRPLEASGTSGMKVAVNGGINISTLDGWWCEAYNGNNGWAIGAGEEYSDHLYQDELESRALYSLLEQEVVPLYYQRGKDGLPREWIKLMKESIKSICPEFNTNRMVKDYLEKFYIPGSIQWNFLIADNCAEARSLVEWKKFLREKWRNVEVLKVNIKTGEKIFVGSEVNVEVLVKLGEISPHDVSVELFYGIVDPNGEIEEGEVTRLLHVGAEEDGLFWFSGKIKCENAGRHGFRVRIVPWRGLLGRIYEPELIQRG